MSSATYGYGVELPRLTAAAGSRDAELLAKINEDHADRLAEAERMNELLYGPSVTLREAVQMIIHGDYSKDSMDAVAQRLYAYELLCEHFGRRLDGEGHIGYLEDLGWETVALEQRTPIGLAPANDFPMTGYLTAREVGEELRQFEKLVGGDEEPEVSDARNEFLWWLKQCFDNGLALVAFSY